MANMLSNGVSGLSAAQVALNTVSNNISNASTDGYSRQSVVQVERIGQSNGKYTIGSGVDVVSVQRAYSQYLTSALNSSNTALQGATTMDDLTTTLNGLLSNSGDLQTSLDDFYTAFSTVADTPSSSSDRQSLLSSASSLSGIFNTLGKQLSSQQTQVNSQIGDTVDSINDTASQIAALNQEISKASVDGTPNDLLDQRDNLVKQLAGYTGISTVTESDGSLSVYTTAGQALVSGSTASKLSASGSEYDLTRDAVYDSAGNDITSQLSGGTLGALIDYRDNVLDVAQNQLGQAALGLASSVNGQQAMGLDQDGDQGAAIFATGSPEVLSSNQNSSDAATVAASVSDIGALTSDDYILSYTGATDAPALNGWSLKTTDGEAVTLSTDSDGNLSGAGLSFSVSGSPTVGDSYEIRPTRDAATSLSVSMSDPSKVAAAAALTVSAASANSGDASATISVADAADTDLFDGATVSFGDDGSYTITDGAGNTTSGSYTSGEAISADGWSLTLSDTPASGDSFTIAKNTGLDDNSNALALADLADSGVLDDGATSIVDAYTNLTTQIGDAGSQASSDLTTQTSLYNQALASQQSAAGVNLDEEAAALIKYQQAYQASAQVISTAQSIFSSLLSAIQG